jgi:hypothetical protein
LPLNQATRSFANVLMRAASSVSMNGRYPALGFAGDAASIANISGGHRNEQAGRTRASRPTPSGPRTQAANFFLLKKSPRGGSRSRTGFAERHPRDCRNRTSEMCSCGSLSVYPKSVRELQLSTLEQ